MCAARKYEELGSRDTMSWKQKKLDVGVKGRYANGFITRQDSAWCALDDNRDGVQYFSKLFSSPRRPAFVPPPESTKESHVGLPHVQDQVQRLTAALEEAHAGLADAGNPLS